MSLAEETSLWWPMILAAFLAFASALILGIDGPEEWSRVGASFAAASLVAAYYFWKLLWGSLATAAP
jgi:hypothetical protein